VKHKIITSRVEFEKVLGWCKETGYCCHDFETNGLPYHHPDFLPTVLGISFQIGSAYILPLGHFDSPFKKDFESLLNIFSEKILKDMDITKIAWNAKFEQKVFLRYGHKYYGRTFDGMLAKFLLDEKRPHDLKSVVTTMIPEKAHYEDKIHFLVKKYGGWGKVPLKPLAKYCAMDCDLEFKLMNHFEGRLIRHGFYSLFRNMYCMRGKSLAECEYEGALIDRPYLEGLMASYEKKIEDVKHSLESHKIIRRYERKFKRSHIKKLVGKIKDEILAIREDDKPNAPRLIANREQKIARIVMGQLQGKKEIYDGLNFASPNQLIELLFTNKYGFKFKIVKFTTDKKTKRETERPSTDEEVLLELQKKDKTGFIKKMLELRTLQKLYSTYVKGVYLILDDKDRVHPTFHLQGTETGRTSCTEPNLQNIPRGTTAEDIKKMFIAPPGLVLLNVDYSQAELRIVAELANETTMIKWFKMGRNIHVASACRANKVEDQYDVIFAITKDEDHPKHVFWVKRKKRAKTINFGILYEQSDAKLAETLRLDGDNVTVEEAGQYKILWFKDFPRIKKYMDSQHKFVRKHGYVKTMFGFKRRLDGIYSDRYGIQLEAERMSTNTPPQGTAAQFGHMAGVVIKQQVDKGLIRGVVQEVYNVHDSLGYYMIPKYLNESVPKILNIMADPETKKYFGFEMKKVKMVANAEVGINWADVRGFHKGEDYLKYLKEANK
jgi:DNA polymerase I-like protein with 3'-5' exonuclease and polymerase domains